VTQGHWQVAKSAFEEILVYEPENLAVSVVPFSLTMFSEILRLFLYFDVPLEHAGRAENPCIAHANSNYSLC